MKNKDTEQQEDLILQNLLKSRSIVISSSVDSKLADKIIKHILTMNSLEPGGEIKVFINSPGGEIYSGFAIFDMLKYVDCPITSIVTGLAASMGSILSLVGDKGRKFALPNARIMIHQPLLMGMQGNSTDLEIHSKQILKTKKRLADMYAEVTGKPVKQIIKDMDRDHWLDAEEAVEYGLLDRIVANYADLETEK